MDTPQQYPTMWTTGYIGSVKISFTFPIRNEMEAYAQAKAITDKLLADGFTLSAPGLEVGEDVDTVGYVLRKDKTNDDGTTSSAIALYPANDKATKKWLWVYLDTAEDVKAFEDATGVTLKSMKVWPTKQAPDREPSAAEYFKVVKPGCTAVYEPNPKWISEEETKFTPKRLFVRWGKNTTTTTQTTPPPPANPPPAAAQAAEPKAAPPADDWEANERRKALTALDGETLTVFKCHYNPQQNGLGNPRWDAMARTIDGATVPLVVWTEHEKLIKKAGYDWPRDAESLDIQVITEVKGSERRIESVLALDGSWMHLEPEKRTSANVDGNSGNPDTFPEWLFDRTKLLYQLSQVVPEISYQERGATVDKMNKENEFTKVSGLDGAVEMVVNRLKAHRKDKVA